jgi:hypothetical protein
MLCCINRAARPALFCESNAALRRGGAPGMTPDLARCCRSNEGWTALSADVRGKQRTTARIWAHDAVRSVEGAHTACSQ